MGTKETPSEDVENNMQSNISNSETLTIFVVKEHNSRSLFSTVVPRKGVSESDVAVSFYQQCIAELGYSFTPIKVKNDQEPAIKAVIDKLLAVRPAQTIVQESPVGASASNGSIENAISCLEDRYVWIGFP